jgi:hypothetical protein
VERSDFTPSGGTVEFYGPVNGLLYTLNSGSVYHVLINKGATDNIPSGITSIILRDRETNTVTDIPLANTVSCASITDINGDLTIQGGLFSAPTVTICAAGDWSNLIGPSGFNEGTGKVVFDGATDSDILTTETFYNVDLLKTSAAPDALELNQSIIVSNHLHILDGCMKLTNPANLYITGHLTIDFDAGLNADASYGPMIYVGKDWSNGNTGFSDTHGFDAGSYSTVIFNGAIDQLLTKAGTGEIFNHLTISKTTGKFRPNDNVTCEGNMTIGNGTWEDNVSSLSHVFYRDFTVQSTGAFLNAFPLNTVSFAGSSNSLLTYSSGTGYFHNLTVDKAPGNSVTQVGNTSLQFEGLFTIEEGTYNLNGYSLILWADASINDGGLFLLPAGSSLVIDDLNTLDVHSGGLIEITGTTGDPVTILANTTASRYDFNVNPGGTIAADHCVFRHMDAEGIHIQPGATVDPAHAFKGCTFMDGAAGETLLTVNNSQTLIINDVVFPENTWGGASNVSKTFDQGQLYFFGFSGTFSGETFDDDTYDRIAWVTELLANATAVPGSICEGSSSQLNANPSGGVFPYTFTWSPPESLSDPSLENPVADPTVTTNYSVTVTDALGTTVSDDVTVSVTANVPVSISIDVSENPVLPATLVTFTATPVNSGATPLYQWKLNGADVGTGLNTYSYIPSDGDSVYCILTSSLPCVTGNPDTSNIIVMIVVPKNRNVTGVVPSPDEECYDATDTITVAGGGNTFLIENGGSAIMIAGKCIRYLPGTTVEEGGYMHGYITTTNSYCGSLPESMITLAEQSGEEAPVSLKTHFIIYPNPTRGEFTLARRDGKPAEYLRVEILSLRGERIHVMEPRGFRQNSVSLGDAPPGIYVVKVICGDIMETFKLIKTN